MINFISSWAEQIIIVVVITTIIEMILPNSKNKKYVQMIIGIYILFTIISPVVKNKEVFSFDEYSVENNVPKQNTTEESSMNKKIEEIYLQELENNITSKFANNGVKIKKCLIDAELDNSKKNSGIHLITIKLSESENQDKINETISEIVKEYEIDISKIKMLKEFFNKTENEKNNKKQIENIVVFIIILIITVLAINNMWSTDKKQNDNQNDTSTKVLAKTTSAESTNQDDLEKKLEDILETMNGVGKVNVLIKYSESSKVVAMYNETNSESVTKETDGDSSKDVKETENKKEIVYTDENGENKPITEKVVMPVIEGAIITAQGAENANVKSSIVSAVEAITGLAVHKIQVFEMKN